MRSGIVTRHLRPGPSSSFFAVQAYLGTHCARLRKPEVSLLGLIVQIQLTRDRLSRRGFSGWRLNVPKRLKTLHRNPQRFRINPIQQTAGLYPRNRVLTVHELSEWLARSEAERIIGVPRVEGSRVGVLS